jgi:hypothetical protein
VTSLARCFTAGSIRAFILVACTSAATASACQSDGEPKVVYRPPLDSVWEVASRFQPHGHEATGVRTPDSAYRTYANVMIEIASDGTPTFVRFPLGTPPYASTGNRPVDKAIQAWGLQFRFSPDSCDQPRIRTASVPVDLRR